MTAYLTATEAAARLGVSRQTLYAYVSRGLIEAHPTADPRVRAYAAEAVARLAEARHRGRRPREVARATLDWGLPVLETAVTLIRDGRLFYRGTDAVAFSETATLEEAAARLWALPLAAAFGPDAPRSTPCGGDLLGAFAAATADEPTAPWQQELVGAPGHRVQRQPGPPGGGITPHHPPARQRGIARGIGLHPPAARIVGAACQGQVDLAGLLRRPALDQGPVGLLGAPLREQGVQPGERLGVAAERQAAGGVAVEAVGGLRPAWQAEAQGVEVLRQRLAAFRPRMHRQSRRLVDDEHEGIAVEEPREYVVNDHEPVAVAADAGEVRGRPP